MVPTRKRSGEEDPVDAEALENIEAEMEAMQRITNTHHEIQKRVRLRESFREQFEACSCHICNVYENVRNRKNTFLCSN